LMPCVVVSSLVVAAWFYRLVERPTLHAARSIGRRSMDPRQPKAPGLRVEDAVSLTR
jgi:peptidoglycan/LPS O-acetylase OafA/YrhL